MTLTISVDPTPLRVHENGTVYVGKTRVMLELVIDAYKEGNTPEQIVENWDVLSLSDVYRVVAYYLEHREDVEAYMRQQEIEVERLLEENEKRFPTEGIRAKLLERLAAKGIYPFQEEETKA